MASDRIGRTIHEGDVIVYAAQDYGGFPALRVGIILKEPTEVQDQWGRPEPRLRVHSFRNSTPADGRPAEVIADKPVTLRGSAHCLVIDPLMLPEPMRTILANCLHNG